LNSWDPRENVRLGHPRYVEAWLKLSGADFTKARSTLQHVGTGEPSKIHSLDFILVVVDIEGEIPIDSRE
jgi:hypothetical protein